MAPNLLRNVCCLEAWTWAPHRGLQPPAQSPRPTWTLAPTAGPWDSGHLSLKPRLGTRVSRATVFSPQTCLVIWDAWLGTVVPYNSIKWWAYWFRKRLFLVAENREGSFPRQHLIITMPFRPEATAHDQTQHVSQASVLPLAQSPIKSGVLYSRFSSISSLTCWQRPALLLCPVVGKPARAVSVPRVQLWTTLLFCLGINTLFPHYLFGKFHSFNASSVLSAPGNVETNCTFLSYSESSSSQCPVGRLVPRCGLAGGCGRVCGRGPRLADRPPWTTKLPTCITHWFSVFWHPFLLGRGNGLIFFTWFF